jgi:hypothetical protein
LYELNYFRVCIQMKIARHNTLKNLNFRVCVFCFSRLSCFCTPTTKLKRLNRDTATTIINKVSVCKMSNDIIDNFRNAYRRIENRVLEGIQARRGQIDYLHIWRTHCIEYKEHLEQV